MRCALSLYLHLSFSLSLSLSQSDPSFSFSQSAPLSTHVLPQSVPSTVSAKKPCSLGLGHTAVKPQASKQWPIQDWHQMPCILSVVKIGRAPSLGWVTVVQEDWLWSCTHTPQPISHLPLWRAIWQPSQIQLARVFHAVRCDIVNICGLWLGSCECHRWFEYDIYWFLSWYVHDLGVCWCLCVSWYVHDLGVFWFLCAFAFLCCDLKAACAESWVCAQKALVIVEFATVVCSRLHKKHPIQVFSQSDSHSHNASHIPPCQNQTSTIVSKPGSYQCLQVCTTQQWLNIISKWLSLS